MDIKKRFLKPLGMSKEINKTVASNATFEQQIMQSLVKEESMDWSSEIANAFANNTEVESKLRAQLANQSNSTTIPTIPAAKRYYLCDERYYTNKGTLERSYYSSFINSVMLTQDPNYNYFPTNAKTALIKQKDLYRNYVPLERFNKPDGYIAGKYEKDFPEARLGGLEGITDDSMEVELFSPLVLGEVEDLTPFTTTTKPTWTNEDAKFTIDPTHDYHFSFDFNFEALPAAEALTRTEGSSPSSDTIIGRSFRSLSLTEGIGPMELQVYVRLHNGDQDDTQKLGTVSSDFKPFIKLGRQNWSFGDFAYPDYDFYSKIKRLNGGFRLRSLIDDCIDPTFLDNTTDVSQRLSFKYVDFVFAVKILDITWSSGPVVFSLRRESANNNGTGKDITNFIDVVDLGKVL